MGHAKTKTRIVVSGGALLFGLAGTLGVSAFGAPSARSSDVGGPIRLDGTTVGVTTTSAGSKGRFTFNGTIGKRVAALLSGSTFAPGCPAVQISLVRPDGTTLGSPSPTCGAEAFLDVQTLDQGGVWTVLVDPQGASVGSASLQAWSVPDDPTKPVTANGAAIGINLPVPGENGDYTLTGTSGEKIAALVSAATFGGSCPQYRYSLVRPDGTTLAAPQNGCGSTNFFDGQTLDQAGTWTIRVDPVGAATGTASLNAYDATDQTKGVTVNGKAVTITLNRPGQNGLLTFKGTAGQSLTANVTNATFTGSCPATFSLSLVRPDGSILGVPVTSCSGSAALQDLTLDQDGIWTYLIDPIGTGTGSATTQVVQTSDDVRAITPNGAPINFNLRATQTGVYTFAGGVGQQVAAQLSNATFPCPAGYQLSLRRPDGTTFGSLGDSCASSAFLDSQTLDQNGTWSYVVTPRGNPGAGTINAYSFSDIVTNADLTGKATKLVIAEPGQNARLAFPGTTGERIALWITGSSVAGTYCPAVVISLLRPDGTTRATVDTCSDSSFLDSTALDASGTWTVIVDPQAASTGTLTVQVYSVSDDTRPISAAGTLKTFTALVPGTNARYPFSGAAGQRRKVSIEYSTFAASPCAGLTVSLVRPDGSTRDATTSCNATFVLGSDTLDVTGTWTVLVDPQGPATGTLVIKLTSS